MNRVLVTHILLMFTTFFVKAAVPLSSHLVPRQEFLFVPPRIGFDWPMLMLEPLHRRASF